jgi:hypothetical protein
MGMGELTCFNNQLTTLTMPNGSEMLSLVKCGQNLLSTLDVSDCQYLGYLDCKANKLTSVDVSNCEGLSEFYCQDNQLASLDVSDCPRLFKIHCYDNRMATLDLSVMAVEYEGQIWHAYAGKQTSDGTTAQTLALTIREYQKPYWDYKLSKDAQNGDINLTVRPD